MPPGEKEERGEERGFYLLKDCLSRLGEVPLSFIELVSGVVVVGVQPVPGEEEVKKEVAGSFMGVTGDSRSSSTRWQEVTGSRRR